jgi:hypothetical protein
LKFCILHVRLFVIGQDSTRGNSEGDLCGCRLDDEYEVEALGKQGGAAPTQLIKDKAEGDADRQEVA